MIFACLRFELSLRFQLRGHVDNDAQHSGGHTVYIPMDLAVQLHPAHAARSKCAIGKHHVGLIAYGIAHARAEVLQIVRMHVAGDERHGVIEGLRRLVDHQAIADQVPIEDADTSGDCGVIDALEEILVLRALRCGRARIATQFWIEVSALAVVGAVGGVLLTLLGIRLIRNALSTAEGLPFWWDLRVDLPVLAFISIAAMIAAIVAGVGPALFAVLQANTERLAADKAMSALTEFFDIDEADFAEEQFGPAVFGASLVNFPRTLKNRELVPKFAPLSSHSIR